MLLPIFVDSGSCCANRLLVVLVLEDDGRFGIHRNASSVSRLPTIHELELIR